jgi:hypothetical protein
MEAAMNRGKMTLKAIPLLIGIGIVLSACAADSGYDASAYDYNYPIYGYLDFDYWGGCCDRDRHEFHDRDDHGFGEHGGHGFGGHDGHR